MEIQRILKRIAFVILLLAPPFSSYFIQDPWRQAHPFASTFLEHSYLLWVLMVAYDRWDWFYFQCTRALLWLTNAEVTWSMTAEWQGIEDVNPVTTIYTKLQSTYPKSVLWQNEESEKIVKLPIGCMVRVRQVSSFDGLETVGDQLLIETGDLVVPFRRATKMLEEIVGILNLAHPVLSPQEEKYRFRVTMPGPNPYFGLFVRRLRLPDHQLTNFICEFTERVGPVEEQVQVGEERIALVTHSVTSLQTLSRRYVTLATLDLTSSG